MSPATPPPVPRSDRATGLLYQARPHAGFTPPPARTASARQPELRVSSGTARATSLAPPVPLRSCSPTWFEFADRREGDNGGDEGQRTRSAPNHCVLAQPPSAVPQPRVRCMTFLKPSPKPPPECPVCRCTTVRPAAGSNLLLSSDPVNTSYRCGKGHVFVAPPYPTDAAASGE